MVLLSKSRDVPALGQTIIVSLRRNGAMVEYGVLTATSLGNFVHRLTYDHTLWLPAILIIAAVLIVIYGIYKL